MQYNCQIRDGALHCSLTPERDMTGAVFCCSGMAPLSIVAGGERLRTLGSYIEVALPAMTAGLEHHFTLAYDNGFAAANRAWMPLGPYLRHDGTCIPLPPTPAGRFAQDLPTGELPDLAIVPQPLRWSAQGGHVEVDGVCSDDDAFDAVARLSARRGMMFRGAFPVRIHYDAMAEDGYRMQIRHDQIDIWAGDYGGRFYAAITILTLLQNGPLPCGEIEDAPRFPWRGQHLDTARHFYAPETIHDLLDQMALLKLNRFHWHFADDEAFRLQVDCLPELWQKTEMRGEGHALPGLFASAVEQGGSYSKDDARAIIAHAKALNIEVMPEIEAPAHALAITSLFPDTRDPDDAGKEMSVQGYQRNALNPAMPRTWEILEALAAEVGALFPFGVIHLGCDELPENTWMGSPAARALMAREGLDTTKDLQGWTIAKLASDVAENDHRPAAWEEAAQGKQGGIGSNAILFSWTGQGPGIAAARAGYDVVMTPAQHVYLDMAHTSDHDDWGANWAAYVDLADTVGWDPVPEDDIADRIIGVQGAFWSEFTTEDSQMWPMLMPRLLGVSAMAWQDRPPLADQIIALAGHYEAQPWSRPSSSG